MRVLDFELGHGVAKGGFDLLLVAALELQGHGGVGNDLLDTGDVGLELLAGFELLAEGLVTRLELGGICRVELVVIFAKVVLKTYTYR